MYVVGDPVGVHELIQEALLATPGHAEFYRDKINAARAKMEAAHGDIVYEPYESGNLRNVVLYDFPKFENLPSAETVRVLGEFLFDERGYVRVDHMESYSDMMKMIGQGPVFGKAAAALLKLPIENKPVPDTRYPSYANPEDVKPWRDWINEIKSGKRTFRFFGNPTEYDLNGPASVEAIQRNALNRKRDEERQIGRKKSPVRIVSKASVETESNGHLGFKIALGFGALFLGIWYYHLRRKKLSPSPDLT